MCVLALPQSLSCHAPPLFASSSSGASQTVKIYDMYRLLPRSISFKPLACSKRAYYATSGAAMAQSGDTDNLFNENLTMPHSFNRFSVAFVGTGTFPSPHRSTPCTVLNLGPELWIFDAGDGTMRQLTSSNLRYATTSKVFISRLDPIHVFGLPQVASYLPNIGDPKPLHIYGPPGLGDYLIASLKIVKGSWSRKIVISEMHDEYKLQDTLKQNINSRLQTQHLGGWLTVQKIFPERSGFWRLVDNSEICALANKVFDHHSAFGFVVREVNKQGAVDMEAVARHGVSTSMIKTLKNGQDVFSETKKVIVKPSDVLKAPIPGRKVVIINSGGDASKLLPAAQGADVVVHDCCFLSEKHENATKLGHSVPAMMSQFASACQPRVLIATRIGTSLGPVKFGDFSIRTEMKGKFPLEKFFVARDLAEFDIPVGGLRPGGDKSRADLKLQSVALFKKFSNQNNNSSEGSSDNMFD